MLIGLSIHILHSLSISLLLLLEFEEEAEEGVCSNFCFLGFDSKLSSSSLLEEVTTRSGFPKAIHEALADQIRVLFQVPSLIVTDEGLTSSAITLTR